MYINPENMMTVRWPHSMRGKIHGHFKETRKFPVIELLQTLNVGKPQVSSQIVTV